MIETILLLLIFHLTLLGSLFVIFKNRHKFNFVVGALIILMLSHSIAIQIDIGTPIPLLYGPLILLLYKDVYGIPVHPTLVSLHITPFIFFISLYTLLENGFAVSYYSYYMATLALSLFGYGLGVLMHGRQNKVQYTRRDFLIYQLVFMNMVASVFVLIAFLKIIGILPGGVGPDITLFLSLALLLSSLFMIRYLVVAKRKRKAQLVNVNSFQADVLIQSNDLAAYQKLALNKKTFLDYEKRVRSILVERKLYLSPELSLDRLAQETHIPKHHFSQLFSVYLKTSFYQLIAHYRIAHALKSLDEGSNITVESLAYECGFNSKTSFNRYFKEITGYTPSEYQNQKSA